MLKWLSHNGAYPPIIDQLLRTTTHWLSIGQHNPYQISPAYRTCHFRMITRDPVSSLPTALLLFHLYLLHSTLFPILLEHPASREPWAKLPPRSTQKRLWLAWPASASTRMHMSLWTTISVRQSLFNPWLEY